MVVLEKSKRRVLCTEDVVEVVLVRSERKDRSVGTTTIEAWMVSFPTIQTPALSHTHTQRERVPHSVAHSRIASKDREQKSMSPSSPRFFAIPHSPWFGDTTFRAAILSAMSSCLVDRRKRDHLRGGQSSQDRQRPGGDMGTIHLILGKASDYD